MAGALSRMALWLPYIPLPLATLGVVESDPSVPLLMAALLLVSAVLARQFIVADENRRCRTAALRPATARLRRTRAQSRLPAQVHHRLRRYRGSGGLVRWEHPQRGLLLPGEFLPLARQNGLMGALTEAVIRRAASDAAGWRAQGTEVPFAVNLFPPSLGDLELPDRIVRILDDRGLSAECLTVEITEDLLLVDLKRVRKVLGTLRQLRIRVSIDDFGSGYSALSYLREPPIDELELDGHFIAPITEDVRADAIVRAMIDLTHTLGMTCVAEGVESAATAARLAVHGCDTI
ncbi:MAG: diguanylate cyclase protein, partial [Mycobacterium sp.]|nr:diguanylate cyclase protein [Mycobacterium sp.]